MIKFLKLKNFKCFQDQDLYLNNITILAGGNGLGKSSVVQSILLCKRASDIVKLGKTNVELNGPYHLQLNTADKVINSLSAHEKYIEISLSDELERREAYRFNVQNKKTTLTIDSRLAKSDFNLSDYNIRYLNAERIGPRTSLGMNSINDFEVGFQGEFTNHAIYQANDLGRDVHKDLIGEPQLSGRFSAQVEAWLQTIIPDIKLEIKPSDDTQMVAIKYENRRDAGFFNSTATGFGITYVLPIIVAGLMSSTEKNSILIIENPEAHLHPLGQSRIGRFLALLSTTGIQVIVETHSDHVVDGIRLQLAQMRQTDNLVANFFYEENDKVCIKKIVSNNLGELSSWPLGFFDQKQTDLRDLLRLKMK